MIEINDAQFWNSKYKSGETGWDIGRISTPLKEYIDQLNDKSIHILIPGAGNAYEAEYLFKNGFSNLDIVDISENAIKSFVNRVPDFPGERIHNEDLFEFEGNFDLILEQTFFCALPKVYRPKYAEKMAKLLIPGGRLVGVLFNVPLNEDRPPFGGNSDEYRRYFDPYFTYYIYENCYNSIPERAGNELFINLLRA